MKIHRDISESKSKDSLAYFGKLYDDYYVMLCVIADRYLKDKSLAEEAVGDIFLNYFEKYEKIVIDSSEKAYLIRSVQNWCLNYIQHQKVEQRLKQKIETESMLSGLAESTDYPLGYLYEKELVEMISIAIGSLPEQCRVIFMLSREEQLTYTEISERLNLSVNTIKTQMKIAIAKLRVLLKDYLLILTLLLSSCFIGQ